MNICVPVLMYTEYIHTHICIYIYEYMCAVLVRYSVFDTYCGGLPNAPPHAFTSCPWMRRIACVSG